jgi:antirestriction protein
MEDFREHYCGEWHSEEEFDDNLIEERESLTKRPSI